MQTFKSCLAILLLLLAHSGAVAEEGAVNIRDGVPYVDVPTEDGVFRIERESDTGNEIFGDWALTSRPCPPYCIQPMIVAEGVATIGELELLDFLQDGETVVVDSRTYRWFQGGTIPGAINIPYDEILDRLNLLGCEADFDGWDCQNAKRVALFCNGNWCGQSPTAIHNLLEVGYPAERIFYYRGGMQAWRMLGLSVK
ncbi:MAG TPA: rhodanese-like domain-containing protein [Paracoccaceae bacterium]|nr:rhodanese-like domain-containing protein [Paracoccaceae bacterium]